MLAAGLDGLGCPAEPGPTATVLNPVRHDLMELSPPTFAMFRANTGNAWNTAHAALVTMGIASYRAIVKTALATWLP
jgi:hypothetical protein